MLIDKLAKEIRDTEVVIADISDLLGKYSDIHEKRVEFDSSLPRGAARSHLLQLFDKEAVRRYYEFTADLKTQKAIKERLTRKVNSLNTIATDVEKFRQEIVEARISGLSDYLHEILATITYLEITEHLCDLLTKKESPLS